jgi:hypothetical protein
LSKKKSVEPNEEEPSEVVDEVQFNFVTRSEMPERRKYEVVLSLTDPSFLENVSLVDYRKHHCRK